MADIQFLNNIDLKQNQLLNARVHVNGSAPAGSGKGSIWLNSSTNELNFHNGTQFVSVLDDTTVSNTFRTVTAGGQTLGATETLAFTEGSNITITEDGGAVTIASTQKSDATIRGLISASGVLSYNSSTGALTSSAEANVDTNLSKTTTQTNVTVNSSTGTNIALGAASTSAAGVMTKAMFDKLDGIATGAQVNVATNLGKTTATGQITITSSTGDDVVVGEATSSIAGLMSTTHHDKLDGIESGATADQSASDIRTLLGTGNGNLVPAAPSSATTKFLRGDGTFVVPSYVANTNTGADMTQAVLKTKLGTGFPSNAVQIGDSNDTVTIAGNLVVSGDTITANVGTLDVEDKNITVNKGSGDTSSTADGAGLTIQDAVNSDTDATMLWNATNDDFRFSHAILSAGTITTDSGFVGNLTGDVTGDASGNAGTVTNIGSMNSGDVTSGGTNNRTLTIGNDKVTYAKMQNVSATNRILGRDSSGAGNVEEITPANVKTMLSLNNVENKSQATILGGNLTGTINSVAVATVTAGAALGATANQDSTSTIRSGTTADNVGLGNVTNESKATMFTDAALTGNPTAPTQSAGNSSTRIATTAFVANATASIGKITKKISGDGTETTFTITHGFSTPHVMTQLLHYGNNGTGATYDVVHANVRRNSDNAVDVVFGIAPTSTEDYLVLITKMPAIS